MNRIMSHLYWLSIYGVFLGHTTMFMWPLGDRELFIDLAESLTGARITYSYLVPGGVRRDLPQGFAKEAIKRTEYFEKRLDEYENIFFRNPLFTSRRSEEHTSELQSLTNLVCRLLLEKKKKT